MTQRGRAGARPGQRRPADRSADRSAGRPADRPPAAPRIDLAAVKTRVVALIEPVVAEAGYDLEDVHLSRAGRRHLLRVLVDTDGGINLDDVAVVSRAISAALDAAEETGGEVIAGEYQLEVGSPGVDRPLTLPRHWRRNVGRLVAVNGVTGRVTAADDRGIVLDQREIAYPDLGPGKVQIEFKRLDEAQFDEAELDDDGDDFGGEDEDS
ncbi:ribosome maturation factor RimP [Actinoplanes sp. NPDC051633]|uniref:ribosome maturation factor RimP n=1 Tax=Actinoplanes sp. NPDC051633 TaxID=3155670 RepID=UPI0034248EE7